MAVKPKNQKQAKMKAKLSKQANHSHRGKAKTKKGRTKGNKGLAKLKKITHLAKQIHARHPDKRWMTCQQEDSKKI